MSLEAGSSAVPRPPPRPTLPTARHISLILSTTPAISAGRRLNITEWPTRPEVASAPYRPGQGTAGITGHCVPTLCPRSAPGTGYDGGYRPLCPTTVPTTRRPLEASALYTRASVILGFEPAETPPPQYKPRHRPSLGLAHSPSTVACTFAAASTPRHSWGSHDARDLMGRPRRPGTPRTDHSDDHAATGTGHRVRTYHHAATGTGHRVRTCRPCWHDAA